MPPKEKPLGQTATFLLPSLKLKQPKDAGNAPEREIHDFLLQTFGGYTATQGNLFGYWKDDSGGDIYGENRAFTVGCSEESRIAELKDFLARTARELDEECIYLELDGHSWLIYGEAAEGEGDESR